MSIIIYIGGILTATGFLLALYFYTTKNKIIKELTVKNNILESTNSQLKSYKDTKESYKRTGKWKWDGWYNVAEKNDPNKKTWAVHLELRELAQSEKRAELYQFEVISAVSESIDDDWGLKEYALYFKKRTGGGWINTNQDTFTWINRESKEEKRDEKLNQLGL